MEFPTISMCEVFHDISTLIYRNLMAMSTEEMIASMPIQGVVLLSTCDKDVPAQAMALATVNKPAIIVTGGTRLAGFYDPAATHGGVLHRHAEVHVGVQGRHHR